LKATIAGSDKALALARHEENTLRAELAAAKKHSGGTVAEAVRKHADDVKRAREEATADAAQRHQDEIAKLKSDHAAALDRYADELAKARASTAPAPPPQAPANATANPEATSTDLKTDDLKLIWGVGPELEKILNEHGIRRFDQIASWEDKDVAWFDGVLPAFKGRAVSEKWIEQCRKLVSGWRPEREIGDKPKDILSGPRNGKADDLKLIWGVGPKLEAMLNKAGFFHFDQIATWTDREIAWVDTQLGDFGGRAVRDKWVEQCKKLATGWRPASDVGERPT
jgi:predicted flap endonuclease-1-like 5' DNA nuclease